MFSSKHQTVEWMLWLLAVEKYDVSELKFDDTTLCLLKESAQSAKFVLQFETLSIWNIVCLNDTFAKVNHILQKWMISLQRWNSLRQKKTVKRIAHLMVERFANQNFNVWFTQFNSRMNQIALMVK